MLLEGVMKVLEHFDRYLDIPQIKELADQVTGRGSQQSVGSARKVGRTQLLPVV